MHHEFVLVPDWTVGIQLALFLASFGVLHFLVFKPYQSLIHARYEKTKGLKEKALEASGKAAKLKEEYDLFMKAERKKVATFLEQERSKIAVEELNIIQSSRDEVAAQLSALRNTVKTEADSARTELMKLVPEYSSLIASKLTGKKITMTGIKIGAKEGPASDQPVL